MAIANADIAFATDLFAPLGGVSSRKMMGGLAIYCEGQIFAMVSGEGQIYLKASGTFAKELAKVGAVKFSFTGKDGVARSMGYWTLPEDALDTPDLACDWARKALNNIAKG